MSEEWIEKFLFSEGECIFYHDETLGYIVTKATDSGKLNHYDEPTEFTPSGIDLKAVSLKNNKDCVLIKNNALRTPTRHTIELYALRLAEISRTIDVNINAQKTPVLVLCSDKQKNSMKHLFKNVTGNEPIIYGDKNIDIEGIKSLKIDAPIVFDKLQIQKHAIWNECMTFLGINNANMDKRERLVADEVDANDEQIQSSANVMLTARETAAKKINELFGLDIKVELRKLETPVLDEKQKEGDEE
jgi:hypothetical protein